MIEHLKEIKVDDHKIASLSLVDERLPKSIRFGNLCFYTSHRSFGVTNLHVENLKRGLFCDFNEVYPTRLTCQSPSVCPVRWIYCANRPLAKALTEFLGGDDSWIGNLKELKQLSELDESSLRPFFTKLKAVKKSNKHALISYVNQLFTQEEHQPHIGEIDIIEPLLKEHDVEFLFIGHIKRFHLHKRQLLTLLGLVSRYLQLKAPVTHAGVVPRVHFFAGKASPEDRVNKAII